MPRRLLSTQFPRIRHVIAGLTGALICTSAQAQDLGAEELKLLALSGAWEADHAEYGTWTWTADGGVCLRLGSSDGDCADSGSYEISGEVLCYEFSWWGDSVGERQNCFTVRPIGADRFETVFHGGAMVSRMFAFRVLEE